MTSLFYMLGGSAGQAVVYNLVDLTAVVQEEEFFCTITLDATTGLLENAMARQKIDIDLYQGDTQTYTFNLYTDEEQTTEWDISTASEIMFTAKTSLDTRQELFQVEIADGLNGNDWSNGKVVVVIPAVDSEAFERRGKYDLQVTINGSTITPVYGDVVVQKEVTEP